MVRRRRNKSRRQVFVDTVAWIALVNEDDAYHRASKSQMDHLHSNNAILTTTEFVLLEVADAFADPAFRRKSVSFINGLRRLPELGIAEANTHLLSEGWKLYNHRLDRAWSLTDCISFVVMESERIREAFTSDHHFEQAGFVKLL
jgi:predicted nucleic acid-binding protein